MDAQRRVAGRNGLRERECGLLLVGSRLTDPFSATPFMEMMPTFSILSSIAFSVIALVGSLMFKSITSEPENVAAFRSGVNSSE